MHNLFLLFASEIIYSFVGTMPRKWCNNKKVTDTHTIFCFTSVCDYLFHGSPRIHFNRLSISDTICVFISLIIYQDNTISTGSFLFFFLHKVVLFSCVKYFSFHRIFAQSFLISLFKRLIIEIHKSTISRRIILKDSYRFSA